MTTVHADYERRFLPQARAGIETRSAGEPGRVTIRGYGLVFFNPSDPAGTSFQIADDTWERFMPGCCDQTIREDDVRCLFNHDANWVLGRNRAQTMRLSVDERGLIYETDPPDSPHGQTVTCSIQRQDVTGSSVGMVVVARTIREDGDRWYRDIERIRLYDAGPTTFPAYSASSTEIAQRSIDLARQELSGLREKRQARLRRLRLSRL